MQKCPELKKLPKASLVSSVNFRRQTPGSINGLWQGSTARNRVDRSHPIDLIPGKQKPFIWAPPCTGFTLGAIPIGLLLKPTESIRRAGQYRTQALYDTQARVVPLSAFDTWEARLERGAATGSVAPIMLNDSKHTRLGMSLQMHSSRDVRTHQRIQILRRFKTAVSLVVTRGAAAREVKGRLRLVFDETDTGEWILPGWTYYLRPGLELYRMPYPDLVNALRPALRDLWKRGTLQEERWAAAVLGKADASRTRTRETSKYERAAAASTPSTFSRQKRTPTPSEPHTHRAATTEHASSHHVQKNGHRTDTRHNYNNPVPVPNLLPATPAFDPFPAVHGAASPRRTPAFPRRSAPLDGHTYSRTQAQTHSQTQTQTRNVDDVEVQNGNEAALPLQPDFDPFAFPNPSANARRFEVGGRASCVDGAGDATSPSPTTRHSPNARHAMTTDATRQRGQSKSLAALAADPGFDDFGLDLHPPLTKLGVPDASSPISSSSTAPVDVDFEQSEDDGEDEGGVFFPADAHFGVFPMGGATPSNAASFDSPPVGGVLNAVSASVPGGSSMATARPMDSFPATADFEFEQSEDAAEDEDEADYLTFLAELGTSSNAAASLPGPGSNASLSLASLTTPPSDSMSTPPSDSTSTWTPASGSSLSASNPRPAPRPTTKADAKPKSKLPIAKAKTEAVRALPSFLSSLLFLS
ncbi:hypothetical protein C8R45DRAFT_506942 [Mycena sanguinolenta]|nr:hypothetical protein C8R45DRAFT_506942 [Mycena sanguinolenta]